MECPKCRSIIEDDCRFCTECGVEIEHISDVNEPDDPCRQLKLPELEYCLSKNRNELRMFCISWFRVGTLAGAVVVIIIAAFSTVAFTFLGGSTSQHGESNVSSAPAVIVPPSNWVSSGTDADTFIRPVPAPEFARRTTDEQILWQKVTEVMGHGPWLSRVVSLQIDPRTRWAWLTMEMPSESARYNIVIKTACQAATAALQSSKIQGVTVSISSVIINCNGKPAHETLFVGDMIKPIPHYNIYYSSPQQIASSFRLPWWSPSLKPD